MKSLPALNESGYPHFKLTRDEAFPRLMVTRRVRDDGARYFGPFLPDTSVRRMLDLLQRTFKLRSCEVEIDGSWESPCVEFYAQRCSAPCVAALCSKAQYQQAVRSVEQLLSGNLPTLLMRLDQDIAEAANALEFEKAAELNRLRDTLTPLLTDAHWDLRLAKVSDVWVHHEQAWQLTTVKAGRIIGERIFANVPAAAFTSLLVQWYDGAYWPEAIFIPNEITEQAELAARFTNRAKRKVTLRAASEADLSPRLKHAAQEALRNLQAHHLSQQSAARTLPELQEAFGLAAPPLHIECYDVAHLSGQTLVAAQAVALYGKVVTGLSRVFVSAETSEIAGLREAIKERISANPELPGLILLDGGRAQLNAVSQMLTALGHTTLPLVAVVKPPRQRHQIAYLLNAARPTEQIQLPVNSAGWRLIQQIRDEAHQRANEAHRKLREAKTLAESASSRLPSLAPLLVPVRLDDPLGDAEDLQPLRATDQEGKLLTKRKKGRGPSLSNPFALKRGDLPH